jgi:glycosyltransferase involved in cell wall biosynthesis
MNIGYVVQGLPKSQTWIPLEMEELKSRGHHIEILDWSMELTHEDYKRAKQCDFLIAHWAYSGKIIGRWGIPFGILCHAYDIWKDNGFTLKEVSKNNNCKFVGCDTDYHRSKYKEWGIDKPLLDTPVCCDVNNLYKKNEYPGDLIVTGGRNKEKKGFKYAVQGFPYIHMFGNTSLEEYKSISPQITLHNWLPLEELRRLLDDSWLFVSPNVPDSQGDMDGQCTTIKEALLMELQVLTTNIAGNREYNHVWFSTPEDISKGFNGEVYQHIIKERNTAGRQYVIDTFSPKVCINKYLEAIECSK